MIRSRWIVASELTVTIRPPFDARTDCVTARSMSPGSRRSTGVHLHSERRRHRLDGAQLADHSGDGGITQDGNASHLRRDLLEQFQPFPACSVLEIRKTGEVAPWPCQARGEAAADRVNDTHEHDRQVAGRLLQRPCADAAMRDDDVRCEVNQFRRVAAKAVRIAARAPAIVDPQVAGPAQFLQRL